MESIHKKSCPSCNRDIFYKDKKTLNRQIKNNTLCRSCAGKIAHPITNNQQRNCPQCNCLLTYKSRNSYNKAVKFNYKCINCSTSNAVKLKKEKSLFRDRIYKKQCPSCNNLMTYKSKFNYKKSLLNNTLCIKCCNLGNRNHFYGKTHTIKTKQKISVINKGKRLGVDNPFYGRTHTEETRKKISLKNTGRNIGKLNSSYGKILRNKSSGFSISGYYKNIYFRSSYELAFIIYLEKLKIPYKVEPIAITYVVNGMDKTYIPDLLVFDKYLVEIKPKNLQKGDIFIAKEKAGEEYCRINGLKYRVIDPIVNRKILKDNFDKGLIKLTDKMLLKFNRMLIDKSRKKY